jgi:hypothetical protein
VPQSLSALLYLTPRLSRRISFIIMLSYAVAFDAIQVCGIILGLATLLTVALSRKLSRLTTWYLVMISGIIYAMSMLLLLGHQNEVATPPPFGLCAAQAALIHSSAVLLLSSGAAFAFQFYLSTRLYIGARASSLKKDHPMAFSSIWN